jgi:hypothetical protein
MNFESQALPFSSHVKVPDYWYQAADWINYQPGDGRVLLTPLNDFYQMPNSWGNYSSEEWMVLMGTMDLTSCLSGSWRNR